MEFKELLQILMRRRFMVFSIFALVFFSCVAGAFLLPKVYFTSVKLLYTDSLVLTDVGTLTGASPTLRNKETANFTHMELVKNTRFLSELIQRLDLKTYSGYPLTVKKLLRSTPFISLFRPRPRISISHAPESFVLVIEASSTNPREAADMANLLAEMYMEDIREKQSALFARTQENIDAAIAQLKARYFTALDMLAQANLEGGSPDISTETTQALETYYELTARKFTAVQELSRSMATLDIIQRQLGKVKPTAISGRAFSGHSTLANLSNSIQQLRTSLAAAQLEKTEHHPDVLELQSQIEELSLRLAHEVEVFRETATDLEDAERAVHGYKELVASLDALLDTFSQKLLTLPAKSAQIGKASSEVAHLNTQLNNLNASLSTLHIARAGAHSMLHVMQPAMVKGEGEHDRPDETLFLLVGIILGIITSVGLACVVDYLDTKVHHPDMLHSAGLPLLAVIPPLKGKAREDWAPVFRSLRNRILLCFPGKSPSVLLVVGVFPGGGTSTVARNTAQSLAHKERRVLLLDLPHDNALPWSSGADISGAWRNHIVPAGGGVFLDRLTLRQSDTNPEAGFSIHSLELLLRELSKAYDLVVIDAGALSVSEDPLLLGAVVDGMATVMEASRVPMKKAIDIHEMCKKAEIRNLGFILNRYQGGMLE